MTRRSFLNQRTEPRVSLRMAEALTWLRARREWLRAQRCHAGAPRQLRAGVIAARQIAARRWLDWGDARAAPVIMPDATTAALANYG